MEDEDQTTNETNGADISEEQVIAQQVVPFWEMTSQRPLLPAEIFISPCQECAMHEGSILEANSNAHGPSPKAYVASPSKRFKMQNEQPLTHIFSRHS